ncbi:MAG: hypothetical protein HYY05_03905 [Chloroflexi bacterium]|nr:hypothetical protein [Chloroflexota bacterium]
MASAPPPAGCGEIFLLIRIAFGVLLPLLGVLFLTALWIMALVSLLTPGGFSLGTLLFIAVLVAASFALGWYLRREKMRNGGL